MSAARAQLELHEGKRWRSQLKRLGLSDDQAVLIVAWVGGKLIEHRERFGLFEVILDEAFINKLVPAAYHVTLLRLAQHPNKIYLLAISQAELDRDERQSLETLFGISFGGSL